LLSTNKIVVAVAEAVVSSMTAALDSTVWMGCIINFAFFKPKLCCCCRGGGVLYDGSPGLHGVNGLLGREGKHLRPSPGMALRGGLFYQQGRAVINHKINNKIEK
jgi:hypothetical protein